MFSRRARKKKAISENCESIDRKLLPHSSNKRAEWKEKKGNGKSSIWKRNKIANLWREKAIFLSHSTWTEKNENIRKEKFSEWFSLCTFVCDLPIHLHLLALLIYRVACSMLLLFRYKRALSGLSDFVETPSAEETSNAKFVLRRCRFFLYLFIYFIIILYIFSLFAAFFRGGTYIIVIFISRCSLYFSLRSK